jgi:hypothetical protein
MGAGRERVPKFHSAAALGVSLNRGVRATTLSRAAAALYSAASTAMQRHARTLLVLKVAQKGNEARLVEGQDLSNVRGLLGVGDKHLPGAALGG